MAARGGAGGGRQGWQGDPLPGQRDQRNRHQAQKRAAPAHDRAEVGAQRRRHHGRQRVAAVDDRQRPRHLARRHELDGRSRRQGPKAAHDHADERPAQHVGDVVWRQRDDGAGRAHRHRQREKQRLAVQTARQRGNEQAGQHGANARDGDPLPRHALGNAQVARDGREQADGHELRGDQREGAHRQSVDRSPGRPRLRRFVVVFKAVLDGAPCIAGHGIPVFFRVWRAGLHAAAARFFRKNAVSLSHGIRPTRSYRSTWPAPDTQTSSFGSAARL